MSRTKQAGLSLVEMMVALVAGLVVIGAVLSFVVTTMRANNQNTQVTRVMQDLRVTMGLVSRELRRAGYDRNAIDVVGTNVVASTFSTLTINATQDCVVIAYDRGGNAGAIDAGESRGFRRVVRDGIGVLQANLESTAAACDGSGWIDLTDPRTMDVTAFRAQPSITTVPVSGAGPATTVTVRDVQLSITGQSTGADAAPRTLQSRIRIRADQVVL